MAEAQKPVQTIHHTSQADSKVKVNNMWWKEPETSLHDHITPILNKIEEDQTYRKTEYLKFARLYSNKELLGFTAGLYSRSSNESLTNSNRLTLNVIKSCVDTASSKIAKMKPKPLFLTSDGEFQDQIKGQKLTKFIEGVFDDQDAYTLGAKIFVDACVFGTGFIKIHQDGSKVKLERVIPSEIKVDDSESIYGKPRQMHQIRFINREVLADMFPEFIDQINNARGGIEGDTRSSLDMVRVTESWHLKSGEKSTDGKHCITIENATLFVENYAKDFFPFVRFTWTDKLLGLFGTGLAEELIGIQIEINKLLITIQKAQHLAAVPRVYIEAGSKVVSAHINNEIGSIIKYVGTAPVIQPSTAIPAEVYTHLENLYNKAYQITGISMLAATSKKPSGLDSGVALREYQDIETERFMLTAMRYEKMFLDLAKILVDLSRDLYESNPDLSVKVKGSKFIETIKWSDVDMEDDKFMMRVFPVSMLPTSPQGRLQKVQELIQSGFISKEDGLALLDYPDLDSVMNLELAARNDAMMVLSKIMETGEYIAPEPFMNLQLTLKLAQSYYLKSKVNSAPEDKLQLLRDFIEDTQGLIEDANAPDPTQAMGMGAAPLAVPEAPPVTDLLPPQMPQQ